ncbi:MAG: WYL domain-containing protein [Ignavibacteriae bacterium]|nr:WYL domain-containing protein [Ignavibacteriota bacterium]
MLKNKSQIARLIFLDDVISRGHYPSKKELAKEYQVSQKTIQRDIDYMRDFLKAPVDFNRKRGGYYYTNPKFKLSPLTLNENDFFAIAVTDRIMEQYSTTPYAEYFTSFYNKLSLLFDDKITIKSNELKDVLSFEFGSVREINKKIFSEIGKAILKQLTLETVYVTGHSGKESTRNIDPYHLLNKNGDWYLIGFCHKSKFVKIFAVSRFNSVKATKADFTVQEAFSVKEYFKDSFSIYESKNVYDIILRFSKEVAFYIKEKQWHSSQKIKELNNGELEVRMRLNHFDEVTYWALSFGKECTVIEPKELREIVLRELKGAIGKY